MPPPWRTASSAYAIGTLYQDINVDDSYYSSDGRRIKVIGKHETDCGERRLTYIDLYPPPSVRYTPATYSVPYGILGYNFYLSKPSAEQIAANKAEIMSNHNSESSDDYP